VSAENKKKIVTLALAISATRNTVLQLQPLTMQHSIKVKEKLNMTGLQNQDLSKDLPPKKILPQARP
jgi:hypothetical protein